MTGSKGSRGGGQTKATDSIDANYCHLNDATLGKGKMAIKPPRASQGLILPFPRMRDVTQQEDYFVFSS